MLAVKCSYEENTHTAVRLYHDDERISTGHAAGLRSKYRKGITGEAAQCRHGKDELQQTVRGILPTGENRVLTEDFAENHGVWIHAQADIQPCAGSMLSGKLALHLFAGGPARTGSPYHQPIPEEHPDTGGGTGYLTAACCTAA